MNSSAPLNALRAFDAAARHLSFKKAADELHVTPAAVGHQVKALEDYLGVQLFRRLNRKLLLTETAQDCLPELRTGFEMLGKAVDTLRRDRNRNVLTVTVEPDFASKWLVRRLERFRDAYPDIDIHLDASWQLVDLTRANVDVGLRYGDGIYPGMRVDRLFGHEVFPVCSPRLLEGEHPLRTPHDLRWHTLLHEEWDSLNPGWPTWEMWLRANGVDVDASRGPMFSHSSMALQAAMEAQGVALASSVLAEDDLYAGYLIRPFDIAVSTPAQFGYYVVCVQTEENRPRIRAFREWVLNEARETA